MSVDISTTTHFIVNWGGARTGFTEVSGLSTEVQVIEYREGSDIENSSRNIPGLKKHGNITLKRGIVAGDNEFYKWFETIKMSTVEKRDITVSLLNEDHEPIMTWKVSKAFPIRIEGPLLNAQKGEVAIETLELAHEGITIENS